eukprot:1151392-Pelagomonas_calceolata.AAC.1
MKHCLSNLKRRFPKRWAHIPGPTAPSALVPVQRSLLGRKEVEVLVPLCNHEYEQAVQLLAAYQNQPRLGGGAGGGGSSSSSPAASVAGSKA